MSTAVSIWAGVCLTIAFGLIAVRHRLGIGRASAWLVVLGLFVFTIEESALTLWFAMATVQTDHDGIAGLVTPQTQAHVIDASIFGIAFAILLGWIAMSAFRRGDLWATRVLIGGWLTAAAAISLTTVMVFSRGLPLPSPGGLPGREGFGWMPLAVALIAWAIGLWMRQWPARGVVPS